MAYLEWIQHYPCYNGALAAISRYFGAGHTGLDSVGNVWDNAVCALFDGIVTAVKTDGGLGNVLEYQSNNGRVKAAYYHLKSIGVTKGQRIAQGAAVAVEGSTGSLATGKHLHTSLWIDGALTDPLPYLKGNKTLPLEHREEEEKTMRYSVGDKVKVNGKIAVSAYSKEGSVEGRGRTYTITKLYEGLNFPYQLGVTGFVREADIEPAESAVAGVEKSEYDKVLAENAALRAKLDEIRRVVG